MAVSHRTRFEVFKRDNFTCQYCGRITPEVILEVDHIIARAAGGSDDMINLRTSCYDCNRGKSDIPLNELTTGEDPHDRAILLLERERQLREYNEVLRVINERTENDYWPLQEYWGRTLSASESSWLWNALQKYPAELIYRAMTVAIDARKVSSFAYVNACLKNWTTKEHQQSTVCA